MIKTARTSQAQLYSFTGLISIEITRFTNARDGYSHLCVFGRNNFDLCHVIATARRTLWHLHSSAYPRILHNSIFAILVELFCAYQASGYLYCVNTIFQFED